MHLGPGTGLGFAGLGSAEPGSAELGWGEPHLLRAAALQERDGCAGAALRHLQQ